MKNQVKLMQGSTIKNGVLQKSLCVGMATGMLGLSALISPTPGHAQDVTAILGGSSIPIPANEPGYVQNAFNLFIAPNCPTCTAQQFFTPEGAYPVYPPPPLNGQGSSTVKQLPFDESVDQGRQMLDTYIVQQVQAGNTVWVYGESQSAIIASMVMQDLANGTAPGQTGPISPDNVHFALVGNPFNPDGGLLSRFPGLTIPAIGIPFGSTPDGLYQTDVYTQQYDGFADVPRYPLNFLADLNAFIGFLTVHPTYRQLTPAQLEGATKLNTDPSAGDTNNYYFLTNAKGKLPLLAPLRLIPIIGKPLADLAEPLLRTLINLGYGPITADGQRDLTKVIANVNASFGVFPKVSPGVVVQALINSTKEGVSDFVKDLTHFSLGSGSGLSLPQLKLPTLKTPTATVVDVINSLVNTVSTVSSLAYSTLLPIADVANALLTSVPLYGFNVAAKALSKGDILGAIAKPLGAAVEWGTLGVGFGLIAALRQVTAIVSSLGQFASTIGKALPFGAPASATSVPKTAAVSANTVVPQSKMVALDTSTSAPSDQAAAAKSQRAHRMSGDTGGSKLTTSDAQASDTTTTSQDGKDNADAKDSERSKKRDSGHRTSQRAQDSDVPTASSQGDKADATAKGSKPDVKRATGSQSSRAKTHESKTGKNTGSGSKKSHAA